MYILWWDLLFGKFHTNSLCDSLLEWEHQNIKGVFIIYFLYVLIAYLLLDLFDLILISNYSSISSTHPHVLFYSMCIEVCFSEQKSDEKIKYDFSCSVEVYI